MEVIAPVEDGGEVTSRDSCLRASGFTGHVKHEEVHMVLRVGQEGAQGTPPTLGQNRGG